MIKPLKVFFTMVLLSMSSGAYPLPFTYDFGFIDTPPRAAFGHSGMGWFTMSSPIGGTLTDFSYSGVADTVSFSLGLSDVTTSAWDVSSLGIFNMLDIRAGTSYLNTETSIRFTSFGLASACSNLSGGTGCSFAFSSSSRPYVSGESYLTLRDGLPNPAPAPGTWVLLGIGLAALSVSRRKNKQKSYADG